MTKVPYTGSQFDSAAFYAPYVPLQMTSTRNHNYYLDDTIVESIRQKGWWILSFTCIKDKTAIFDRIFELATGPFYCEDDRGELIFPYSMSSRLRQHFTVHLSSPEDAMMIYLAMK